jgi:hypothetical protein
MKHPSALIPIHASPEQHSQGGRRFSELWLILARVSWVVIALLSLSVLIAGLPSYFTLLQTTCESVEVCAIHGVLAPEAMRALQTLGISPLLVPTRLLWSC